MEVDDHISLLPKLGRAIDAALQCWSSYITAITRLPTYKSIISGDARNVATKVEALEHILDTLPTRYTAIEGSYNDPNLGFFDLSELCAHLSEELKDPESGIEVDDWFHRTLTSRRFIRDVAALEKSIKNEEQWRSQELRRLKASHACLMIVQKDGEVDKSEVRALLDAMEEVGIPLLEFHSGVLVADTVQQQRTVSGNEGSEAVDHQEPDTISGA